MEVIPSCSTPFFTAPSSPSSSHHPYYEDYEDGDPTWPHRLSLAFDRWGIQPEFTPVPPAYDDDGDREMGCAGDFEFEFDGLRGKVSSASANDLFLEGKIRSLVNGDRSDVGVVTTGESERGDCSCTTPTSLRLRDVLVQGEDEEEDGGDWGDSTTPRYCMAGSESTGGAATATTCSIGYLSSLLPGMSLLRNRDNSNKSWSLKDFLFRSTSEGRGTSKAAKLAKGRSPDKARGSGRGRHGRTMSAHELHYRENRMVSEEMRRRTTLPFKPGFFACLGHGVPRNVSRPGSASFSDRSNRG